MPVARTRTFRGGNSQVVRLPRNVAYGDGVDLIVVRAGDVLTIYPAATTVPEMVQRLRELPVPPYVEKRDGAAVPERPGM